MSAFQHPTALVADSVTLGDNTRIYSYSNLYGCTIGKETQIGAFVEIQKGAIIGERCKISSHSFVCEGVEIENAVFIGHNVSFCNDNFPRACNEDGELANDSDWTCIPTKVETGSSIGSGSTILPGVTIGRNAIIGAGSVVTKDIPADSIAVGNPAKVIRKINHPAKS